MSINKLTAKEARSLMNDYEHDLELIFDQIRQTAKGHKGSNRDYIKTYTGGFDVTRYTGTPTHAQQKIINTLRSLGYSVTVRTETTHFVDSYLMVSWKDEDADVDTSDDPQWDINKALVGINKHNHPEAHRILSMLKSDGHGYKNVQKNRPVGNYCSK